MAYYVAADFLRGKKLIAAAVVYSDRTPEPAFTYVLNGRKRTAYLYRRKYTVPPSLYGALDEHVRHTAVSWARVLAHADCCPDQALSLAVIRAVERWMCRSALPQLRETQLLLPTKHPLKNLPTTLKQVTRAKDWRIASARALCRKE